MRQAVVALLALFLVGCDNIDAPNSIDGTYSWMVMRVAGCPVALGLFDKEVNQSFTITGSGGTWSASFTDTSGASVSMSGSYNDGRFTGSVTVTSGGRTLAGRIEGRAAEHDGMREIDGSIIIEFDSLQECEGGIVDFWAMTGSAPQEPPPQTIEECPAVDIVFLMDTSGSMDDEAQGLCDAIASVEQRLRDQGLDEIRSTLLGITETLNISETGSFPNSSAFACLTDTVYRVVGGDGVNHPQVPGNPWPLTIIEDGPNDIENIRPYELNPFDDEAEEYWAAGTALIAANFDWIPDVSSNTRTVRIIVPISDESPQTGQGNNCWTVDRAAIDNAARVAVQNRVRVSPILGSDSGFRDPCIAELAQRLADRTGGIFAQTTLAGTTGGDIGEQIADFIFNIVEDACAGQAQTIPLPPEPEQPPPPQQFSGDETLVAFDREGEMYTINASTGVATPGFEDHGPTENLTGIDGPVSSAVWIPSLSELWVGLGGDADPNGAIYRVDVFTREAQLVSTSSLRAVPGMTIDPSSGTVYAMDDEGELNTVDTTNGQITFVGSGTGGGGGFGLVSTDGLVTVAGNNVWSLTALGVGTDLGAITVSGLPASTVSAGFRVTALTTLNGSSNVYGIVQERGGSGGGSDEAPTFLIRLTGLTSFDVVGQIVNPQSLSLTLDGLANMPSSLLAEALGRYSPPIGTGSD